MNNILGNLPPVVKNLLIINIIVFIGTSLFESFFISNFAVFYPDSPLFKTWQVITYMFMHGDLWHIFFNMFALVMFGAIIERVLGSKRFLNFYLICGLGALVLQFGVQAIEVYQLSGSIRPIHEYGDLNSSLPQITNINYLEDIYKTPLVGASGAIYGLLLAFAYLFPNMEMMLIFFPVPVKAKYFIPVLIVIEIFLGFSNSGSSIAHLAHVGGALFGYILLKVWKIRRTNFY
ncbi:rhomboid family intramembrane serine protease [Sphingobacterium sp. HJSM2_6]|uniref:rhomboid family intramembrane serine protease n=1 Tax=Sphingobacterium sp. HJSM2_6 TaxID=3366264 RepID=UPI003BD08A6C